MSILEQMLADYQVKTSDDVMKAEREIMQKITLGGLYRGGFFNNAAFYGGTCLRIFHKLERFSEDMDFSLLKPEKHFTLEPYLDNVQKEFESLGMFIEINRKEKTRNSNIESAFLKQNTPIYTLEFEHKKNIKIKIEVDIEPPQGFSTESKLLLEPFSFFVNTYSLPDLYAGKMHAILYRGWKNRIKGRDWYDFEWYVRKKTALNLGHFEKRAIQTKHIKKEGITENDFITLIKERILNVDFEMAKKDIRPFVLKPSEQDIWSKDYFLQLTNMIIFK